MSAEAQVMADLYDLWADENADPYPRPWSQPKTQVFGKGTRLTPEEFHERWRELSERAELKRLRSLG